MGAAAERELPLRLRGGGEIWPVEDGGDAGRAVCMALRMAEVLIVEMPVVANGDEARRRKVDNSEGEGGEGGETALSDPPEGVREWEVVAGFITPALTGWVTPLDTARARGRGDGGEDGEDENLRGDAGLVVELLGDVTGEPGRFDGSICDADVA